MMRDDNEVQPPGGDLTARTMAPQGASQDLFLRALQPILAQRFGTRLIIDNASGQDGVRAARLVKADPPDGRHLLVTSSSTLTFYGGRGEAGFAEADFDPLLGVGRYNFVVITGAAQPWADFTAVLGDLRARGRPLRYAGTGHPDFLIVAAMARQAGVAVELLPLNGPALLDAVLTGQADVGLGTGTHQPLLAEGRVRVVARLHPNRDTYKGDALVADAPPTPSAFGVNAMLDNCILISAPMGLPEAERAQLIDELRAAVDTPEVTALLTKRLLMVPGITEGSELAAVLIAQRQAFSRLKARAA
jgi:tripartite-type tricarboxylate transporter receptor subunit TctC